MYFWFCYFILFFSCTFLYFLCDMGCILRGLGTIPDDSIPLLPQISGSSQANPLRQSTKWGCITVCRCQVPVVSPKKISACGGANWYCHLNTKRPYAYCVVNLGNTASSSQTGLSASRDFMFVSVHVHSVNVHCVTTVIIWDSVFSTQERTSAILNDVS